MRDWNFFACLLVSGCWLVLTACASGSAEPPHRPTAVATEVVLPGPEGAAPLPAPNGGPEQLPGVAVDKLDDRERHLWWQLVSQLWAPCSDQAVSIAQCVKEARPCAACTPAANLVASKIHAGAGSAEVQAAYGIRFGPKVKKVDLADSPFRGPQNAPVQLVVWSDFQCGACKRAIPIIDAAFERHEAQVRLIHKFYPLRAHKNAEIAARAAVAARNQGRYWQMEHLLFENQHALEESDLIEYAKKLGLQLDRFRADMADAKTTEIIERDKAEADRAGLTGTPFILINGREFDLALFSLQNDLDMWLKTEIQLAH